MPLGSAKNNLTFGAGGSPIEPIQRQRSWTNYTNTQIGDAGGSKSRSVTIAAGTNRMYIVSTMFYRSGANSLVATLNRDELDNATSLTPYPGGSSDQTIKWTNATISSGSSAWMNAVVIASN